MKKKTQSLQLLVTVFDDRHLMGSLAFTANNENYKFQASAEAAPDSGVQSAPTGTYKLVKVVSVPDDLSDHYGNRMFLFEATAGAALANPNQDGKFILTLHAGETDENDHLFQTEGGIRISNDDMDVLFEEIQNASEVTLEVEEKHANFFTSIGHRKISNLALVAQPVEEGQSRTQSSGGITDNPFFWMWAFKEAEDLFSPSNEASNEDAETTNDDDNTETEDKDNEENENKDDDDDDNTETEDDDSNDETTDSDDTGGDDTE